MTLLTDEEFIAEYISQCVVSGQGSQPQEIIQSAEKRIKEIDACILQADRLRPEKNQLLKVIKNFGSKAVVKKRSPPSITMNQEIKYSDLEPDTIKFVNQILSYLEKHQTATPRDLMECCNVLSDRDQEIYAVIKWLYISGICVRNAERLVCRGPNWANRPNQKGNNGDV